MCTRVLICSTEFAPPTKVEQIRIRVLICTRVHFHKTPFIWPKYTPGANLHPGCIFAPGCILCILPQHQYLASYMYIITLYISLYYILKPKIPNSTTYTCVMASTDQKRALLFNIKLHNNQFSSQHPSIPM